VLEVMTYTPHLKKYWFLQLSRVAFTGQWAWHNCSSVLEIAVPNTSGECHPWHKTWRLVGLAQLLFRA